MQVKPVAGSLGAEVLGVDLRRLNDTLNKEIRRAFLKHKVLFFRDQELNSQEYLDFAATIGQPSRYPYASAWLHRHV